MCRDFVFGNETMEKFFITEPHECGVCCENCTCGKRRERGFEVVDEGFRKFPNEDIVIPQRGDNGSAGYDIRIPCEVEIQPHSYSDLIFTDIRAYMNNDEVLQIYVRSSIGCKKGLTLANGTGIIDSSYYYSDNQGNIGIKLYNSSDKVVNLEKGERVCQGIFINYLTTDEDEPLKKVRTGSGFGSSNDVN